MSDCRLVIVKWRDSRRPVDSWCRLSDFADASAVECASVGWLLSDGDVKVLAPNMGDIDSDDPQCIGAIQIPAEAVISMVSLGEI